MLHANTRRRALLCGAALTLLLGGDALAQTANTSVEEVVVTARKREERLVDVPVAATVMDTRRVDQYASTDITSIGQQMVGVSLVRQGQGGSGAALSIRGVGNLAGDYGTEQPVAIVVDGMSLTRGHAVDIGLFDLDSVQVLKGPQALFFGKNSPAGVVAISTTNPGHEFGGYVRAGHEFKTDTNFAEGAVSVPLAPTLAVRIAGRYSKMSGGYAYNDSRAMPDPFPGENTFILPGAAYTEGPGTKYGIARGTVAWTPPEAFDAT